MNKIKEVKGWDYLLLGIYAFAALGLEVILAFLIEPILYGSQMNDWLWWQNILHWVMTCILWGVAGLCIARMAKTKYEYDLLKKAQHMKIWQWIAAIVCIIFMFIMSYLDWNGIKVVQEYYYHGLVKFIFQYIYYFFETGLFLLIIIFGQKAFERWFKKENIPYGGIVAALTWGVAHIFTKGNVLVGILSAISGFIFGIVYLLVNRDFKKAYLLLYIMFVI